MIHVENTDITYKAPNQYIINGSEDSKPDTTELYEYFYKLGYLWERISISKSEIYKGIWNWEAHVIKRTQ